MGDNIRVAHPRAGIRFDASLLKRPMATADAMIESLMRHYGDLRMACAFRRSAAVSDKPLNLPQISAKRAGIPNSFPVSVAAAARDQPTLSRCEGNARNTDTKRSNAHARFKQLTLNQRVQGSSPCAPTN